jgi:hypothetical protein
MDLKALFDKYTDEYIKFGRVANKLSSRPDVHAFLLLDRLVPGTADLICHSEHDEIWLGVEPEDLAKVITEEQVIELVRCGVRFDGSCLQMFT